MIKQKSGFWWLTIFANPAVTTTISPHIYVSKYFYEYTKETQERIIRHENIHLRQQKEQGLFKFLFLYIFCFPLFYNPWRYKWELEAYTQTKTSQEKAEKLLQSWSYGWLIFRKKEEEKE